MAEILQRSVIFSLLWLKARLVDSNINSNAEIIPCKNAVAEAGWMSVQFRMEDSQPKLNYCQPVSSDDTGCLRRRKQIRCPLIWAEDRIERWQGFKSLLFLRVESRFFWDMSSLSVLVAKIYLLCSVDFGLAEVGFFLQTMSSEMSWKNVHKG